MISGYFVVSGLLEFMHVHYEINYGKEREKVEEKIGDITWEVGISRESVRYMIYALSFLFGWILLPIDLIEHVLKLFGIKTDFFK
jgi:hypothetical protein